jgi:hypothetical protein
MELKADGILARHNPQNVGNGKYPHPEKSYPPKYPHWGLASTIHSWTQQDKNR